MLTARKDLRIFSSARRAIFATTAISLSVLGLTAVRADEQPGTNPNIEQMKEMMRQAGVPEEQLEQLESVMGGISKQEESRTQDRQEERNLEYEQAIEELGLGQATVTINGESTTLDVIRCDSWDAALGQFSMEAQNGPDRNQGRLIINGGGDYAPDAVQFSDFRRELRQRNAQVDFDGQTLSWSGRADSKSSDASMTVSLKCRAESGVARKPTSRKRAPSGSTGKSAPSFMTYTPQEGSPTIRVQGREAKSSAGSLIEGDCDGTTKGDLKAMSVSGPWTVVGHSGGSNLIGKHSVMVEKEGGARRLRLSVDVQQEQERVDYASILTEYGSAASVSFAGEAVDVVFASAGSILPWGYNAVYPVGVLEDFPMNTQGPVSVLAVVHVGPVGSRDFSGWSKDELIGIFRRLRTSRCLGEGLKKEYFTFSPTVVYE